MIEEIKDTIIYLGSGKKYYVLDVIVIRNNIYLVCNGVNEDETALLNGTEIFKLVEENDDYSIKQLQDFYERNVVVNELKKHLKKYKSNNIVFSEE